MKASLREGLKIKKKTGKLVISAKKDVGRSIFYTKKTSPQFGKTIFLETLASLGLVLSVTQSECLSECLSVTLFLMS